MNPVKQPFEEDDYAVLNNKYFKKLRETKGMVADPSGWTDTYSAIADNYPNFKGEIQLYHTDISNQLSEKKSHIINLASQWDCIEYANENITLCHSVTVGSVIVMAFLISRGVKTIISETPNYFSTFYQAASMGLNMIRIPTYCDAGFKFDVSEDIITSESPCAIWITQPRTALGINQAPEHIKMLAGRLSPADYLIIDEATEQLFPSVLSPVNFKNFPRVIKIRSVFKGLGINGIRLAFIAHHEAFRDEIADYMEIFLGALDIYSINHAVEIAKDVNQFKLLLSIANSQVTSLRQRAEKIIRGTCVGLSNIENGYIGSAVVNFKPGIKSRETQREEFVRYCSKQKVPVILGSAMGFAMHEDKEFIRLNYFNRENNIIEGLRIISGFGD